MSLIYQALKKAQIAQRADAVPVYGEEAKGGVYFNLPAARTRIVVIVFSLALALFAGWWAVGRRGLLIPRQTVSATNSAKDFRGANPPPVPLQREDGSGVKSSDAIALSERGGKNSFQTALEAARAKNLKGMEFYKQGDFPLAKSEFLSSIEIFPQYAEAYNNLGLTYKQLGDMKNAENSYEKALEYKPDYPEAMNNYGVVLEAMGNSNEAREYFKKAVLIAPEYPDPYLNMAISLEKGKRFEQAISYYEGFLSCVKQGDNSLIKNVRERMLYLSANRFEIEKNRQKDE